MEAGVGDDDPEAILAQAIGLARQAGEISEEGARAAAEDADLRFRAFLLTVPENAPLTPRYVGPVVYGAVPGGVITGGDPCLVFIPRDRAAYLAAMHGVLQTAATWGEARERLSPEGYQDLLQASGATERPDFEAFYRGERRRARGEGRRLTRRAAWRAYTALGPDERQPLPDEPLAARSIGSYVDGDWPGWPKGEMCYWVPRVIRDCYGECLQSVFNGEFIEFRPDDERALVEAFARHGCPCTRDDELVGKASGY